MKTAWLIRPLQPSDKVQAARFLRELWGSERMVVHGVVYYPAELPGFVAEGEGEWVGLVTYCALSSRHKPETAVTRCAR